MERDSEGQGTEDELEEHTLYRVSWTRSQYGRKTTWRKTKSNKRGQIIGRHMCHKMEKNAKTL